MDNGNFTKIKKKKKQVEGREKKSIVLLWLRVPSTHLHGHVKLTRNTSGVLGIGKDKR